MSESKAVGEWMGARGITVDDLVRSSALDKKVIEAIIQGRYTPSPQQRQRIAAALGVELDQLAWGQGIEVQHLYGHGPQFGRTP
jgi:ribosome-binding protein aMBF1 (putative translation factor)